MKKTFLRNPILNKTYENKIRHKNHHHLCRLMPLILDDDSGYHDKSRHIFHFTPSPPKYIFYDKIIDNTAWRQI